MQQYSPRADAPVAEIQQATHGAAGVCEHLDVLTFELANNTLTNTYWALCNSTIDYKEFPLVAAS